MDSLQELTIKSIESHAKSEVRLASLELAITNMHGDHKDTNKKLSEVLERLAVIQENQRINESAHQVLHRRIDDVKTQLDDVLEDHNPCRSLAAAATENNDKHREMNRRLTDIMDKCKACPVGGYKELTEQMEATKIILQMLVSSLNVVTYRIKGLPLWMIFMFLVIIGAAFDVANHWQWIAKAWMSIR